MQNVSQQEGGPAGAGRANYNWQDTDQSDKKGKFKFFHMIIVAIFCMILGSYLAQGLVHMGPEKEL